MDILKLIDELEILQKYLDKGSLFQDIYTDKLNLLALILKNKEVY